MCSPGHKGHDDLTSSPPSSGLSPAVSSEFPSLHAGNRQQGLRSLRDLTQHFTARADDSHAAPVYSPQAADLSLNHSCICQALVRFLAYHRIKPHAPPLVRAPVNSFEFHPYSPGAALIALASAPRSPPTPGADRLQRGLPGYLILFDTHAFVPQRQSYARNLPSPSVFFHISTDFTPTRGIPVPSHRLQPHSFQRLPAVKLRSLTPNLQRRLRTLYAQ